MWRCIFCRVRSESSFKKRQWRKNIEVQTMWLFILLHRLFEVAYDQVSNFLDKLANFPCPRTKIFRIFFGFQIVLYGGCDGGSCKKNQKSQCFVHFLIFLMVREWIYVDVDRPRYTFKIRLAAYAGETIQLFDRFIIFLS